MRKVAFAVAQQDRHVLTVSVAYRDIELAILVEIGQRQALRVGADNYLCSRRLRRGG